MLEQVFHAQDQRWQQQQDERKRAGEAKFKHRNREGMVWLCFETNGQFFWLHPIGRIGDCIRA